MHHNKSFKMRVPKKHPKNLSKIQFSDAFWLPKTLQNRRKIVSKTTSKKEWKKKANKNPPRPSKKNPPRPDQAKSGAPPSLRLPPLIHNIHDIQRPARPSASRHPSVSAQAKPGAPPSLRLPPLIHNID